MTSVPHLGAIAGAYPLYNRLEDATPVIERLAASPLIGGLEVPFNAGRIEVPASSLEGWRHVVTMIPDTVAQLKRDPTFGLASQDPDGRAHAVDMVRVLHAQAMRTNVHIVAVELHSAPTRTGTRDALAASLREIAGWEWGDTQVVLEHCDAWSDNHPVAKGFLRLEDELDVVESVGMGMSINWARSVIETRERGTALEHVRAAAQRGLLRGLMFSSVADRPTPYGGAWADAHLPPAGVIGGPEASLLTGSDLGACLAEAGEAWRGFKINARAETLQASVETLLATAELLCAATVSLSQDRPAAQHRPDPRLMDGSTSPIAPSSSSSSS